MPYARISPELKLAVLVAEDIDFFSHHGFAVAEMKKAVQEAWEEGEMPRGASTLTQQLAKNLWLSPSRNPLRKLKEALLTRSLEKHLAKRRILELYLNVVEFAPGVYGAEAAAQRFFGKPAAGLSAPRSGGARGRAAEAVELASRMRPARSTCVASNASPDGSNAPPGCAARSRSKRKLAELVQQKWGKEPCYDAANKLRCMSCQVFPGRGARPSRILLLLERKR